eukprot:13910667-Alexandrium_andersonii.AAC.1
MSARQCWSLSAGSFKRLRAPPGSANERLEAPNDGPQQLLFTQADSASRHRRCIQRTRPIYLE